jgi:PTS system cellobiose-specific IIA component
MTKEELYGLSFQLILHAGNARSCAMEAMYAAKEKNFEEAAEKIKESEKELNEAHHFQTSLIHSEANGTQFDIPIILIHAQDHLMTAMTVKDLAVEIIDVHQRLADK